jgi:bacteriorhodopsin
LADVSKEQVAQIFRTEEQTKKESVMKHAVRNALLAACFMLVSYLTYSSNLKIEAIFFTETVVDF